MATHHPGTYASAADTYPGTRLDSASAEAVKRDSRAHFASIASTLPQDVARLFPAPKVRQNREGCATFGKRATA